VLRLCLLCEIKIKIKIKIKIGQQFLPMELKFVLHILYDSVISSFRIEINEDFFVYIKI
jgi:hypothetical protein